MTEADWLGVGILIFVVAGFAVIALAAWADSSGPRCNSYSGTFVGYRCDKEKGHEGEHEALTSRTTTPSGREVGRVIRRW